MSKITTYRVFDKWWLATQPQPLNKSITKTFKWPSQTIPQIHKRNVKTHYNGMNY
jgi:hypothetical protein